MSKTAVVPDGQPLFLFSAKTVSTLYGFSYFFCLKSQSLTAETLYA